MTTIAESERAAPPSERFLTRHALTSYFLLTFLISWGGVLLVVGSDGIPGTSDGIMRLLPMAVVAMIAGPSVAGLLLTGVLDGRRGLHEYRTRLLRWRVSTRWYAAALLIAPLVTMAVLVILSVIFGEFRPRILAAPDPIAQLALGVAISFGAGIVEELGWTGFATPRLRRRYGVLASGVLLGVVWSAWHLLVGYWGSGDGYTGDVPVSVFLITSLFTGLLAFRVLMVWVYDRTRSLLLAMIMHTSLTASVQLLDPAATGAPLLVHGFAVTAGFWLVILGVAIANRGRIARMHPALARTLRVADVVDVSGDVKPGFEGVRAAFVENFTQRGELGGACCAYWKGEKVVDLWGGVRDGQSGAPWEKDTMVLVWSASKGLAAMTLALAHSRGWLDYDERVATYWPEFAQNGKQDMTVRQLLAHQGGLFAFDEPVDADVVADPDRLAAVMARAHPAWPAGSRQSYHGLTLGFYQGELIRRVDPRHRTLGQFFQDEIATPLAIQAYIRLPETIPDARLATLAPPAMLALLLGMPPSLLLTMFRRKSDIYRALAVNPGTGIVFDEQRIYRRNFEVPSGGAVVTARGVARAYSEFAAGGEVLGLSEATLRELAAPATPARNGFIDDGLGGDVRFSLGFMKPGTVWRFGGDNSYGSPGTGGSLGFADPDARVGYAYVTSQSGTAFTGDPRDVALRDALYAAIAKLTRMPLPASAITVDAGGAIATR